jgi:hypothetical protein
MGMLIKRAGSSTDESSCLFLDSPLQCLALMPLPENKTFSRSPDLPDFFPYQIKGVRNNVSVLKKTELNSGCFSPI